MKNIASALLFLFTAQAAIAEERDYPLPLSGSHTYRFLGVYPIFKAELYAPTNYEKPEISPNRPLDLQFTYYRSVSREQLVSQADRALKADPLSIKRFSRELDQLNAAYQDVREGDTYRLSFRPDLGTRLYLNGQLLTTVEGNEFPQFYFRIWLGEEGDSKKISKALWSGVAEGKNRK